MAAADFGNLRPVAFGRLDGSKSGSDDRLGHEGGDGSWLGGLDRSFQLGGQLVGIAQGVRTRIARPIWVRGAEVTESAQPALVGAPQRLAARQVQGAQRVAVIAAPAGEHDPAIGLALREMEGPNELERGLGRFRPPGHGIDRRLVDREMRTDRSGVPLEHIGGELAAVGECKAARLLRDHSRDARAPVADPDDDSAARCIQVCPPLRIPDGRTLGAYGHGQLRITRTPENAPGRVSRRRWRGHDGDPTRGGPANLATLGGV